MDLKLQLNEIQIDIGHWLWIWIKNRLMVLVGYDADVKGRNMCQVAAWCFCLYVYAPKIYFNTYTFTFWE